MDPENVGTLMWQISALAVEFGRREVVEQAVVDPLAVKGDEGVGHRAVTAATGLDGTGDQHLFAAVWVEQH